MSLCCSRTEKADKASMPAHYRVPVFDPESGSLKRLSLKEIDSSEFDKVKLPKWRWTFDLYANSDLLEKVSSYDIISRKWENPRGKSNLGRLHMNKLGIRSDFEHLLSEKHRMLHIGTIPVGV